MKALVFRGPGQAGIEQIQRFHPGDAEVVVRVHAAAVCTTERRIFSGELQIPFPIIGGHEVAGVIEWVPPGETRLAPGDHVIIDSMRRCGACYYCLKGSSNLCLDIKAFRGNCLILGGGFAEYVVLPAKSAFKVSSQLAFEEAALAEPMACCLHSINRAQPRLGETVAIIGAGTMGAIHLLLAKLLGVRTIIFDLNEERLKLAGKLGADLLVNPAQDATRTVQDFTDSRGPDVIFVTASSQAAGELALRTAARRARIVLYASTHPPAKLDLDWNRVHYDEIMLTGSEGKTPEDLHQAANLLSSRAIDVRPLVSRVIRLEELPEELSKVPTGETQRVVVRVH